MLSLKQKMTINRKVGSKQQNSFSLPYRQAAARKCRFYKLTVVFGMWRAGQLKLSSTLHFPRRAISFLLTLAQGHNPSSRGKCNEFFTTKIRWSLKIWSSETLYQPRHEDSPWLISSSMQVYKKQFEVQGDLWSADILTHFKISHLRLTELFIFSL